MHYLIFFFHNGLGVPVENVQDKNINYRTPDGDGSTETETCQVITPCDVNCEQWCYPSTDWPYNCPTACNGTRQSPIDICSYSTATEENPHIFNSYNVPIGKTTIRNDGHAVVASWNSTFPNRTIDGDALPCNYTLAQFHFHWGCKNNRGSEHTINGTRHSMELHLVHYRTIHGNLSEAVKHEDGVVVFGILFDVGEENAALKNITDCLSGIKNSGSEKEIDFNVAVINLIPTNREFYNYKGSLPTPPCNEVVTWSVFSTPLKLSENQVQAFRMLNDKEGKKLCDNYRDIQPLNGRVVNKYQPLLTEYD